MDILDTNNTHYEKSLKYNTGFNIKNILNLLIIVVFLILLKNVLVLYFNFKIIL